MTEPKPSACDAILKERMFHWAETPVPPSANRLWRIIRGRSYRSKEYMDWLDVATAMMTRQLPRLTGEVDVAIELRIGTGVTMRSDLDNYIKPIMDALKPPSVNESGVITKPGAHRIDDDNLQVVRTIFTFSTKPVGKRRQDARVLVGIRRAS